MHFNYYKMKWDKQYCCGSQHKNKYIILLKKKKVEVVFSVILIGDTFCINLMKFLKKGEEKLLEID